MNPNKKLKIGVIGCGTIADIHAQAIRASKNTELVAAFDQWEPSAKAFGEKYEIPYSTDWDQFISDAQMDAVSICTPSGNHLDVGEKAAGAGKHVIVEKPIEVTLERANQLVNFCRQEGVQLAVIFQTRFIPQIRDLKQQLDNNVIGKTFMGDAYVKWYRSQAYYDSGVWRGTMKLDGGGALINQAIHTIDLLQWLMGGVESLYGQIGTFTHKNLEGEDNAVATLRFKSGAIGVIEGSTSIQPSQPRRVELHGEKGSAILVDDEVKIELAGTDASKEEKSDGEEKEATGTSSPLAGFSIEPHRDQFDAIAEAITKGETPPISGEEAMKALAIIMAIYESSKTNMPVNLNDFINKAF
ncbi:MAG: Gfo/Idh/MocA family oxidoreductase [Bacteroidota bacterium]